MDVVAPSTSAPASPTTANLAKLPSIEAAPAVILKAEPKMTRLQSFFAGVSTAMATISDKAQAVVRNICNLCTKAGQGVVAAGMAVKNSVTQSIQAVKNRVDNFKFARATSNELPGQILADEAAAENATAKANKMPTSKLPCPNGKENVQFPIEVAANF